MPLEAPILAGRLVQLEPLGHHHVDELLVAASEDRTTYDWTVVPADRTSMTGYVDMLLADQQRGSAVPFAQRRLTDGALIGCTRFMRLESFRGREFPDEVEVGGTWLAASAQRSGINTEAKLLLFTHAFDVWDVRRLCLCTDARNQQSRTAIERVGAKFEGILRNHRGSWAADEQGLVARDSAMFAITNAEWPAVRLGLETMLR